MRLQVLRGYEGKRVDTKEYNNRERQKLRLLVYICQLCFPSRIPSARAEGAGPNYQSDGKLTLFRQPGCLVLRQLVDYLTVHLPSDRQCVLGEGRVKNTHFCSVYEICLPYSIYTRYQKFSSFLKLPEILQCFHRVLVPPSHYRGQYTEAVSLHMNKNSHWERRSIQPIHISYTV